jgi:hypothetical protein
MNLRIIVIFLIFILIFNFSIAFMSEREWYAHSDIKTSKEAVCKVIGMPSIILSIECSASRNPILENVCECLGDLPGGGCYHQDCSLITPPTKRTGNQIKVIQGD